jgi:glutamate-1-semialdehyde 2,1-aminomutase
MNRDEPGESRLGVRNLARSRELLAENERLIPGGLASINRKAEPCIAFAKGKGARIWDVDGNEYILGHSDEEQNEAVIRAIRADRSNYGSGPTAEEGELARLFLRCVPTTEKVQFFNTGSEPTAQAIRVARASTGRDHIILMQGGYNGRRHNRDIGADETRTPHGREMTESCWCGDNGSRTNS